MTKNHPMRGETGGTLVESLGRMVNTPQSGRKATTTMVAAIDLETTQTGLPGGMRPAVIQDSESSSNTPNTGALSHC